MFLVIPAFLLVFSGSIQVHQQRRLQYHLRVRQSINFLSDLLCSLLEKQYQLLLIEIDLIFFPEPGGPFKNQNSIPFIFLLSTTDHGVYTYCWFVCSTPSLNNCYPVIFILYAFLDNLLHLLIIWVIVLSLCPICIYYLTVSCLSWSLYSAYGLYKGGDYYHFYYYWNNILLNCFKTLKSNDNSVSCIKSYFLLVQIRLYFTRIIKSLILA